jgi:hypothetical protein
MIPQGMRVLRQCKVPRAEVVFVTIQRENIRPSKKEMSKAAIMLPKCPIFAVKPWITTSPYRWPIASSVHLYYFYSPHTALRTFTSRRDQLVICGQYNGLIAFSFDFVIVNVRKLPYLIPRTFHTVRLNLIRFEQRDNASLCNNAILTLQTYIYKTFGSLKYSVSSDTSERNYPCRLPEETTWLVTKCDKIFLTGFNCHSTKTIKSTHLHYKWRWKWCPCAHIHSAYCLNRLKFVWRNRT